jgi:hypothetical protein
VHVLVSAVLKLMRVVRIPPGLRLYRGLGGRLALPASFGTADGNGLYGYAEWGFLSTTSSRAVAVQARIRPRTCTQSVCERARFESPFDADSSLSACVLRRRRTAEPH